MTESLIKLDKIDKKILFELDKNCRITNTQLARIVKRSRETVTYRINRLVKLGVIEHFITSINPHKLGFQLFKVYLQLESIPEERERFYRFLLNHKNLYWMGQCDGVWDVIFLMFSKDAEEFYDLKNQIFSEFKNLIVKKETGTLVGVYQYPKKFLVGHNKGRDKSFWAGQVKKTQIDALDKKILDILINNARIPITLLAKEVNSSIEKVSRRMKHLIDSGVIIQFRTSVDFHKLGMEFYKAIIYFKSVSKVDNARLDEYLLMHNNGLYQIRNVTPWDLEPEFAVKNYKEFNEIINDMQVQFKGVIRHIETVLINKEWWMPGYKKLLLKV